MAGPCGAWWLWWLEDRLGHERASVVVAWGISAGALLAFAWLLWWLGRPPEGPPWCVSGNDC